jgi:hypothetical protein
MIPKKFHFSWVHNDLEVAMVGPKVDLTFEHETNILMSIHIYHTDFMMKQIKSKINKYKINNNNTYIKHEFKVKYEGY